MYLIWILAAMVSVTGYYALSGEVLHPLPAPARNMSVATNMGIYRAAVVSYATSHPAFSGTVADGNLVFPSWYVPLTPAQWTNYIATDGTIVIYAPTLPTLNIVADIVSLSRNSRFAGQANTATGRLDSPAFGDTNIPLPSLPPGMSIPDGSPVWLAHRN